MPVIPSYTANNSIPSLGAATASGWGEPMGKVATQLAAQGKALADVSYKIAETVSGFSYPKTAGQGDVFVELGKTANDMWKYEVDRDAKLADARKKKEDEDAANLSKQFRKVWELSDTDNPLNIKMPSALPQDLIDFANSNPY